MRHLQPLLNIWILGEEVACEQQRSRRGLVPGEDEDELVGEDLVLRQDLVLARGLDAQLERVHGGDGGGVSEPGV